MAELSNWEALENSSGIRQITAIVDTKKMYINYPLREIKNLQVTITLISWKLAQTLYPEC